MEDALTQRGATTCCHEKNQRGQGPSALIPSCLRWGGVWSAIFLLIRFGCPRQVGWADVYFAALVADDADEVRTAEMQVLLLAELIELREMNASHRGASFNRT